MQDFHKLKVWEKAHALAMDVYRVSEAFPRRDGVAITTQLRRAALSVPTNIAEGAGKFSGAEFRRFLEIALGSAAETHYHLIVARDIGLLETTRYHELAKQITEVRRMLTGLIKRVKASSNAPRSTSPRSDSAPPSKPFDGAADDDNNSQPTARAVSSAVQTPD
jgi:four helix bundle protein